MRAEGFYWVRLDDKDWEVAKFSDGEWQLCGNGAPFDTVQFAETGHRVER